MLEERGTIEEKFNTWTEALGQSVLKYSLENGIPLEALPAVLDKIRFNLLVAMMVSKAKSGDKELDKLLEGIDKV